MWKAHSVMQKSKRVQPMPSLFKTQPSSFQLPDLSTTYIEELFDQIELLGFPLSDPWSLLQDQTPYSLRSHDLTDYVGKTITIQGYLIAVKNTTTSNRKTMHFGTFIDRDGNWLDTIHFPPVAEQFRFQGKGIYTLTGVVAEEFDVYSLEVERMHKEPYVPDPRYSDDVNKFKQAQRDVYRSSGDSMTYDYTSYGRGKRMSKRIEALQK
jgi:DNA polymerase-3 subunit alpha